ncbi:MAG: hypothetical protein LBH09_03825 [Peptococcaceae bacterium]|jgi:gluconokinase|nr:hypothetical protein [Peptococcaceae bacterium]
MYILVLESSTASAKAMLYDTADSSRVVRSQAYRQTGADTGKRDVEGVFQETADLGRELATGKDVAAIALSCTWHSLLLCGQDMSPRTPVYLWSNTEASELCGKLRKDTAYTRSYYQKTGCMVNAIYPFFKLKLLAQQGYDLTRHRILGQGSYNTFRLTGEWVVTDAVASGSGLMDIRAKTFDPELLRELGIKDINLGRLATYKETLPLSKEGAAMLGLSPGIPVIAAMPDGALNQVGSGAMAEGVMTLSLGTSGAMRLTVSRPVMPDTPGAWCYLGPDTWLSGAATSGCCNCVDWFRDSLCGGEASYATLDAEAAGQVGDTPVFLPFLYGERCPGWQDDRRGGFLHVMPSHTRGSLYRGLLEGILFNLYQCYQLLCGVHGTPDQIRLSGGIANSPFWTQMCADVFGHEMDMDDEMHASMMGGVRLASRILGIAAGAGSVGDTGIAGAADIAEGAGNLDSGCDSGVSGRRITPNPEATKTYREKYSRYLEYYDKAL